jgi:hypothetical protein
MSFPKEFLPDLSKIANFWQVSLSLQQYLYGEHKQEADLIKIFSFEIIFSSLKKI